MLCGLKTRKIGDDRNETLAYRDPPRQKRVMGNPPRQKRVMIVISVHLPRIALALDRRLQSALEHEAVENALVGVALEAVLAVKVPRVLEVALILELQLEVEVPVEKARHDADVNRRANGASMQESRLATRSVLRVDITVRPS